MGATTDITALDWVAVAAAAAEVGKLVSVAANKGSTGAGFSTLAQRTRAAHAPVPATGRRRDSATGRNHRPQPYACRRTAQCRRRYTGHRQKSADHRGGA